LQIGKQGPKLLTLKTWHSGYANGNSSRL